MMGTIHSDAVKEMGCCLHTLVGRRADTTAEFAARYGYRRWTTSLDESLADDEIDVVILANPSELHAETALAALMHGKHTLVEIPIAMNLTDAERVVAAAHQRSLTLGVVHPARMQPEFIALRERILDGEEFVRHVGGRFFIHRLENRGASGYLRSWTDNLLWHHTAHLVDFGLWVLNSTAHELHSFMPPPDPKTGIPMEVFVGVETPDNQSLVCTGSYNGRERIFEVLIITDCDSYRVEWFGGTLTLGNGNRYTAPWEANCARVTRDFVEAVRQGRLPATTGASTLPAMRLLQAVQDRWDQRYGARALPGRPLN